MHISETDKIHKCKSLHGSLLQGKNYDLPADELEYCQLFNLYKSPLNNESGGSSAEHNKHVQVLILGPIQGFLSLGPYPGLCTGSIGHQDSPQTSSLLNYAFHRSGITGSATDKGYTFPFS